MCYIDLIIEKIEMTLKPRRSEGIATFTSSGTIYYILILVGVMVSYGHETLQKSLVLSFS